MIIKFEVPDDTVCGALYLIYGITTTSLQQLVCPIGTDELHDGAVISTVSKDGEGGVAADEERNEKFNT